jgi:hypothetical protein
MGVEERPAPLPAEEAGEMVAVRMGGDIVATRAGRGAAEEEEERMAVGRVRGRGERTGGGETVGAGGGFVEAATELKNESKESSSGEEVGLATCGGGAREWKEETVE